MTDLELKRALRAYTQPGADREGALKEELMARLPARAPRRSGQGRRLAIAAAVVLAVTLAAFTPPGRAVTAAVGEKVMGLIETMFPPKEVVVAPEGEPETVTHMPHGDEPEAAPEGGVTPGYVIYVDEETYTMTEDGDLTVVEPRDPPAILGDDGEPVPQCRLTVEHRPELAFDGAEETVYSELAARCAQVELEERSELEDGSRRLMIWDSLAWDGLCIDARIVDDGQGGVYVLTAQYFVEATEGHGARFSAMMDTFQLVS